MADSVATLEGIDRRLDALLGADLSLEPEHVTADALISAAGVATKLQALMARLAARVDDSKVWQADGSRSAAAWMERQSGWQRGECRAVLRRGQRLGGLPLVAEAFAAGEITAWHVDRIAKLHARWPDQVTAAEADLVGWARDLDCDGFTQVVGYWCQHIDPDGVEDDATARYRKRRLNLSDGIDGCGLVDVEFEPLGWATFKEALRRIEHQLWEQDWADAREQFGDLARPSDLARSDAQRRYDALIELATRATANGTGGLRPRPLVTVHVDHTTLAGRVCELSTGTVVTPGEILPLLCGCDIERAVFNPKGRVIDLGRRSRLFVGGTRRAVEIRHRHCTHPGCTTPAEHCQIDHIHPWETGGTTTPTNGRPLCGPHHRHRTRRQRGDQPKRSRDTRAGPDEDRHDDEPG